MYVQTPRSVFPPPLCRPTDPITNIALRVDHVRVRSVGIFKGPGAQTTSCVGITNLAGGELLLLLRRAQRGRALRGAQLRLRGL